MDAVKRRRATPLARMLTSQVAKRVTALDAFELAKQKWLAGERLDIGKLADELGVGRATVFRWVGTREQLYGEVISSAFSQTIEWARRASTGTGAVFLTRVTQNLLAALIASKPLRTFVAHDPEFAMRIVMSASSPVEHRVVGAVRGLIEGEVAAGHLKPAIDIDSLAYVIVRIAESFLYRDVLSHDPPDIATATKAIGLVFAAQAATPAKRTQRRT
ncbi:MAG: QsdR family transcriptional regulator [Kofleriaceae bacterium]